MEYVGCPWNKLQIWFKFKNFYCEAGDNELWTWFGNWFLWNLDFVKENRFIWSLDLFLELGAHGFQILFMSRVYMRSRFVIWPYVYEVWNFFCKSFKSILMYISNIYFSSCRCYRLAKFKFALIVETNKPCSQKTFCIQL